jgi:hypothetical protein
MQTFRWEIPHDKRSLILALDIGNRLLLEAAGPGGVRLSEIEQDISGHPRRFRCCKDGCEFSGIITVNATMIVYVGRRPLPGLCAGLEIRNFLMKRAPELMKRFSMKRHELALVA